MVGQNHEFHFVMQQSYAAGFLGFSALVFMFFVVFAVKFSFLLCGLRAFAVSLPLAPRFEVGR
jgi:hypothetical protein